jgi:hypothetical protein
MHFQLELARVESGAKVRIIDRCQKTEMPHSSSWAGGESWANLSRDRIGGKSSNLAYNGRSF